MSIERSEAAALGSGYDPDALDDEMRGVLEDAFARASRMGDTSVTAHHVVAALLASSSISARAKARGGDPDAARALIEARSKRAPAASSTSPKLDLAMSTVLRCAKDEAPRQVGLADLVLAATSLEGPEASLFVKAFRPRAAREPMARAAPVEGPLPASPLHARGVGALVLSAELVEALGLLRGSSERHAEHWRLDPGETASLELKLVRAVEESLGTCLPDDFWGAVAARAPRLHELGIGGSLPDDATPSDAERVDEILRLADHELPGDLVAIVELDASPATLLAVAPRVSYAARHEQHVFRVVDRAVTDCGTLGHFLLDEVKRMVDDERPIRPVLDYRAHLVE